MARDRRPCSLLWLWRWGCPEYGCPRLFRFQRPGFLYPAHCICYALPTVSPLLWSVGGRSHRTIEPSSEAALAAKPGSSFLAQNLGFPAFLCSLTGLLGDFQTKLSLSKVLPKLLTPLLPSHSVIWYARQARTLSVLPYLAPLVRSHSELPMAGTVSSSLSSPSPSHSPSPVYSTSGLDVSIQNRQNRCEQ